MKYYTILLLIVVLLSILVYSQKEGFLSKPIQGFIIPKSTIPKRPSAATNSQGGLVSIG